MDDIKKAVQYILAKMETNGVGIVEVKDGRVMAVKKHTIEDWLKKIEDAGQEELVIYIKDGSHYEN